ncbi:MAG TPA: potassium/proton antiporter [Gemmatimonadota bacterium]|nr:potassium/proton antiporter [Gemmatimonadota bacterium]
MFAVDRLILLAGVLLVLGIVSSKLSSRVGLPVLVLFLVVGMLAGEEGPGGLAFESYTLAHGVGTLALAVILFDGGLRTDLAHFRMVFGPSLILATVGVVLTALIVGAAAVMTLNLPWLEAFLLASIVSSTDAAAVFAVFRSRDMRVRERVSATLEIESASNDPMAVLLTVACIEVLQGELAPGVGVAWFFVRQMALGGLVGWLVGRGAAAVVNRIDLDAAGLYPVLIGAAGLLAFGAAATVGGSGFLAVYIAGIVLGGSRLPYRRGVFHFHDGLAWIAQIAMFTLLGLLSFPSRLASVTVPALLVAGSLILVARPLAVGTCLFPFRYSLREVAFIAWGGLKGAVPIILATYPFMWGLPGAETYFDVVFFVVLVSAVAQGWSLPPVARLLGLRLPAAPRPPATLEITALRDIGSDIVEYVVGEDSRAAHLRVRDLALPDGVLIAMIVRGEEVMPPRGSTQILPEDHVFVLLRLGVHSLVDRVFGPAESEALGTPALEFPLRGTTRIAELEEFYGIRVEAPGERTLDELLRAELGDGVAPGDTFDSGLLRFTVREVLDGRVETVGLAIDPGAG